MASVSKTAVSRVIAQEKDDEPKMRSREEYKKERELEEVSDNNLAFSRAILVQHNFFTISKFYFVKARLCNHSTYTEMDQTLGPKL